MKRLGYTEIEGSDIKVFGKKTGIKRKELPKELTETIRFLASTKDLDMAGTKIVGRVDFAVEEFIKGTTNICRKLNETTKASGIWVLKNGYNRKI